MTDQPNAVTEAQLAEWLQKNDFSDILKFAYEDAGNAESVMRAMAKDGCNNFYIQEIAEHYTDQTKDLKYVRLAMEIFSHWSSLLNLVDLSEKYPELAKECVIAISKFEDFKGLDPRVRIDAYYDLVKVSVDAGEEVIRLLSDLGSNSSTIADIATEFHEGKLKPSAIKALLQTLDFDSVNVLVDLVGKNNEDAHIILSDLARIGTPVSLVTMGHIADNNRDQIPHMLDLFVADGSNAAVAKLTDWALNLKHLNDILRGQAVIESLAKIGSFTAAEGIKNIGRRDIESAGLAVSKLMTLRVAFNANAADEKGIDNKIVSVMEETIKPNNLLRLCQNINNDEINVLHEIFMAAAEAIKSPCKNEIDTIFKDAIQVVQLQHEVGRIKVRMENVHGALPPRLN